MNKEEILAMEAGRELDAFIAEKVMGWKRAVATDGATEYWDNGSFCSGRWVEPTTGGFRLDDYSNTWNPSESISVAWEVVEKFPISMIERVEVFEGNITVNVSLYSSTESEKVHTASSNSFALSACKAALLAVMDS